jgi:uncharacterized coiled-coil DUF342 family protein
LKTYAKELNGHVQKRNRNTYLDETAQEILDQHRKERSVIVTASTEETQLQLNTLSRDLEETRSKYSELQKELISSREEYNELQKELSKVRADMIEMQKKHLEELGSYRPSLFGFYRKLKTRTSADQGEVSSDTSK